MCGTFNRQIILYLTSDEDGFHLLQTKVYVTRI